MVEMTAHADPLYQHLSLTAERKFWRCVEWSADVLKFVVPTGEIYYLTFDQNPSDVACTVSVNGNQASLYKLPQYAIQFQPGVYSILFTDLGYDPSVIFDLSPTLPDGYPLVSSTPLPSSWSMLLSAFVGLGLIACWRQKRSVSLSAV